MLIQSLLIYLQIFVCFYHIVLKQHNKDDGVYSLLDLTCYLTAHGGHSFQDSRQRSAHQEATAVPLQDTSSCISRNILLSIAFLVQISWVYVSID